MDFPSSITIPFELAVALDPGMEYAFGFVSLTKAYLLFTANMKASTHSNRSFRGSIRSPLRITARTIRCLRFVPFVTSKNARLAIE